MIFHRVRLSLLLLLFNVATPFIWSILFGIVLLVVTGPPDACDMDGCGIKNLWWNNVSLHFIYFMPLVVGMYLVNHKAIEKWWSPTDSSLSQSRSTA